jgi:hypothetical protein
MVKLNKLFSLITSINKQKKLDTSADCTKARSCTTKFTAYTQSSKTKKFRFLKIRTKRPQPATTRIASHDTHLHNNANQSAVSSPPPATLNDLSTSQLSDESKTIYKQDEPVKSSTKTSISSYFSNVSKNNSSTKSTTFIDSSIASEVYTLEQMYNDNNIYGELNDMFSELASQNSVFNATANNARLVNSASIESIVSSVSKQKHANRESSANRSVNSCSSCSGCSSTESEPDDYSLVDESVVNKSRMSVQSEIKQTPKSKLLKSILVKRSSVKSTQSTKSTIAWVPYIFILKVLFYYFFIKHF